MSQASRAVIALAMAGCASAGTTEGVPAATSSPTSGVAPPAPSGPGRASVGDAAGLCPALDAARNGDIATARARFDHGPLHDLATRLLGTDRADAARLLEAKSLVEADLSVGSATASRAQSDLTALTVATQVAHAALGESVSLPCA